MYIEAQNLSNALVKISKRLMESGVKVLRRGFLCTEFPGAVLIKINNPTDRYVRIPQRKWNKYLGWIESLWLASGENDLEMPAAYVKNLMSFSDNGITMRAGYGPRIRNYGQYVTDFVGQRRVLRQYHEKYDPNVRKFGIDQLEFVIEKFKEDMGTREAVITIHDPIADDFAFDITEDDSRAIKTMLHTKDTPCTRSIHFMIVDGKMNCYVDIRSNDIVWGFSAVNVFNFTLMQEYVAAMVGVPVGVYYHKADNLHVYADFVPMLQEIAENYDEDTFVEGERFEYFNPEHDRITLAEFDTYIKILREFEANCRGDKDLPYSEAEAMAVINNIKPLMFQDWAILIYNYWFRRTDERGLLPFTNPLLNSLFGLVK